jgi:hypothetical protein
MMHSAGRSGFVEAQERVDLYKLDQRGTVTGGCSFNLAYPTRELLVIEGGHAVAVDVACVMQRIRDK